MTINYYLELKYSVQFSITAFDFPAKHDVTMTIQDGGGTRRQMASRAPSPPELGYTLFPSCIGESCARWSRWIIVVLRGKRCEERHNHRTA